MSKGAKNVAKDIKAGFKNIKTTYDTLYNRTGPGGGAKTVATNVKYIVKGSMAQKVGTNAKGDGGARAKLAAVGAASVTPIGPIVAFAAGVKKSADDRAKLKAIRTGATKPPTDSTKNTGPKSAPKTPKTVTKTIGKTPKK
jgi:hypothetical protein